MVMVWASPSVCSWCPRKALRVMMVTLFSGESAPAAASHDVAGGWARVKTGVVPALGRAGTKRAKGRLRRAAASPARRCRGRLRQF